MPQEQQPEQKRSKRKLLVKAVFVGPEGRSSGKLHRTGNLFWSGDPNVESGHNTVGYAIAHIGGNKIQGVEKRFFRRYYKRKDYTFSEMEDNLRSLSQFQAAGLPVVPQFWLALTKGREGKLERSLFMTDLTERGKFQVYPSHHLNSTKVQRILSGLKNSRQMWRQVSEAQGKALSMGHDIGGILGMDAWMFVVDPKTNTGRAVIADVDYHSPDKKFFEYPNSKELGWAGIPKEKRRETIEKACSVLRQATHPEQSVVVKLASGAGRFSQELQNAASEIVESDKERFEAIGRVYSTVTSLALRVQVGGQTIKADTSGLTKAQRADLYQKFMETDSGTRRIYGKPSGLARLFGLQLEQKPIYTIGRKSRRGQEESAMIGKHAAKLISVESGKLGIPLFSHDSQAAGQFEQLKEKLRSAPSPRAARKLLSENQEVIENKLLESLAEQFGQNVKFLASLRARKDRPPYAVSPWELQRRQKFKETGYPY